MKISTKGGDKGGELVFEGTPEELKKCERSFTAKVLKVNKSTSQQVKE